MQYQTNMDANVSAIRLTSAPVTIKRIKSQQDNLDVVIFETFKPKPKDN